MSIFRTFPSPLYITARLVRRAMPQRLAARLLSRGEISVESLYNVSFKVARAIEKIGVERILPKRDGPVSALEAGAGLYNPTSAPLMLSGVDRLILLEPYLHGGVDYPRLASRYFKLLWLAHDDPRYPLPKTVPPPAVADSLPPGVETLERFWEDTGLADGELDYIISVAVLEHLRNPEEALRESARVLKPGGWMISHVDLQDHFRRYPYEMLKFSPAVWRFLTPHSGGGGFQNRWRLSRWLDALRRHGFTTEVIPTLDAADAVERQRPGFHKEFRDLPIDDLRVSSAMLLSQKKA